MLTTPNTYWKMNSEVSEYYYVACVIDVYRCAVSLYLNVLYQWRSGRTPQDAIDLMHFPTVSRVQIHWVLPWKWKPGTGNNQSTEFRHLDEAICILRPSLRPNLTSLWRMPIFWSSETPRSLKLVNIVLGDWIMTLVPEGAFSGWLSMQHWGVGKNMEPTQIRVNRAMRKMYKREGKNKRPKKQLLSCVICLRSF